MRKKEKEVEGKLTYADGLSYEEYKKKWNEPKEQKREYSNWEKSAEWFATAMIGVFAIIALLIGKQVVVLSIKYMEETGSSLEVLGGQFVMGVGMAFIGWMVGKLVLTYIWKVDLKQSV